MSQFTCEQCQRTLPAWMESSEGICLNCSDGNPDNTWVTDQENGSPTGSEEIDGPVRSLEPLSEDSTDSNTDTISEDDQSTSTGTHSVDHFWHSGVDTSHLESATEASQQTQSDTATGSGDPLDRKIDSWKEQLLDLTRRSNLVNFTATKTKSLPLHRAAPQQIADQLFEEQPLYIRRSEPEDDGGSPPDGTTLDDDELASIRSLEATENSLNNLRLNQKRFQRERGVDSLFIALGTLRWYDVDHSDSELRTPLFLVQATLSDEPNRNADRHDYQISSEDADLQINPALRKLLLAERGVALPPDKELSLDDLEAAFAFVSEAVSGFDRWKIVPEVILGIFDFSKFGLYADLEENRHAIKSNPFVRALNGDPEALPVPPETPAAGELDDEVSPADTYQVVDADSSQQEAIEAAKRGMSFVLQGPPGTGKSQTISNIIAEKMAAGETVLFVSEKQAALDVVKSRLDDVGLGRFCLEAHGEKASKNDILEDLGDELQSEPLAHPDDRDAIVSELTEIRSTLNQYQDRLFYTPPGQDITPYQAFGIVANRDALPRLEADFGDPTDYRQEKIESIQSDLDSLAAFGPQLEQDGDHPWQHTTLSGWQVDTGDRVETTIADAIDAIADLQSQIEQIETFFEASVESPAQVQTAILALEHLRAAPEEPVKAAHFQSEYYEEREELETLGDLTTDLTTNREELLRTYDRTIFEESGVELHGTLSEYGLLRFVTPSYYRFKQRILAHADDEYSPGLASLREDAQLLMEVQTYEQELEEYEELIETLGPLYDGTDTDWGAVIQHRNWVQTAVTTPYIDEDVVCRDSHPVSVAETHATITDAYETWTEVRGRLANLIDLSSVSIDDGPFDDTALTELHSWLERKAESVEDLQEWVQYKQQRDAVIAGPAGDFLTEFISAETRADELVPTFERNFYEQWLKAVYAETNLAHFSATEFNSLLDDFRHLDQQQREYAKAEIQHRVTNQRPSTTLEHASSTDQAVLRREIQKSRQHKPLRELFDEAASLITDLKPVFMMSPLSVAQYLRHGSIEFDAVVFDEASQIMPQDAISSIIRGSQLIIAGDSKQLPPTSFFQSDTEAADGVREDLESILDEMTTVLPEKRLLWHYRSRTNELIEFSNVKYYNGALRTFPDNQPDAEMGVQFEYVEDGLYDRGGSSTNEPEARRVLKLINDHIEQRSSKSLGVVAFSSAQAQAIRETIEEARETDPTLDAFVADDDALEGFFVKSLENVQGDERDVLIFSVGYGPDSSGKIAMNFGPLNRTGGERRLNVAVTRAKELIQVVSSIQPGDIDLGRTGSQGVEDFKHYLEYAKHGERALDRQDAEPEFLHFDSEFEESVYTALEDAGLDVVTQVQSSGYSIDLAVKHPDRPGEYVLGIECDGAAYHSSKTARDRDRTRQAVLEDLGWTIHRVWSPDWAANKQRELSAIVSKVESLLNGTLSTDGGASADTVEPVSVSPIPESDRGGVTQYVSTWEAPTVPYRGDQSLDEVPASRIAAMLTEVVETYGPIETETAFRLTIEAWDVSRLGKNIRQTMNGIVRTLCNRGRLRQQQGFLWSGSRLEAIPVRINDGAASRTVDEIAIPELARGASLLLEAGHEMTRGDLVLETARLFEYQRIGSRIRERINEAVSLLVNTGCATATTVDGDEFVTDTDQDAEAVLLDQIYQ